MFKLKSAAGLSLLFFCTGLAYAQENMIPAKQAISNLDQAFKEIKAKSTLPIVFPENIPVKKNQQYYASWSVISKGNFYWISVDTTPTCHGAKFCSIGYVSAEKGKQPEIYKSKQGKVITRKLKLYNGIDGYFTPAHAGADYWPTMMVWKQNNILHNISWQIEGKNQENIIVYLANSALEKGNR